METEITFIPNTSVEATEVLKDGVKTYELTEAQYKSVIAIAGQNKMYKQTESDIKEAFNDIIERYDLRDLIDDIKEDLAEGKNVNISGFIMKLSKKLFSTGSVFSFGSKKTKEADTLGKNYDSLLKLLETII